MKNDAQSARIILAILLFSAVSGPAMGQSVGIRAGRYTDMDGFFVGVELLSRVSRNFFINPNVEYVFVSNLTYMTFNLDFHYDFYTTSPLFFWVGAGLGVLYSNPEGLGDSATDVGANLLFGIAIKTGSTLTPYVQGKLILADREEFVLGIGLRF